MFISISSRKRYNSPDVLSSTDGDSETDEAGNFDGYESCDEKDRSDTQQNHPSDDVFYDLSEDSTAADANLDESDFDDDEFYDDGEIPQDYTDSEDDAPSPDPSDINQQKLIDDSQHFHNFEHDEGTSRSSLFHKTYQ